MLQPYDLYATLDSIKGAIAQSEDFLEDGEVQKARSLLSGLGSEIVISVTNIPLATYPDAIKAITPLIDDGKIEEAKAGLQRALNTMVVTKTIIPIPVMRAEAYLEEAEKLTENKERSDEENEKLTDLLDRARTQLEMAELLGYGTKGCFKPMYEQLDEIATKTQGGKGGEGFFEKLKRMVSGRDGITYGGNCSWFFHEFIQYENQEFSSLGYPDNCDQTINFAYPYKISYPSVKILFLCSRRTKNGNQYIVCPK